MIVKCIEVTMAGRRQVAIDDFVSLYVRHRLGPRRSVIAVHNFANTGHGFAFFKFFYKIK